MNSASFKYSGLKKIKVIFVMATVFSLFLPILLFAQDVAIKSFVSNNKVTLDGRFQFSIEVSGKSTSLPDINFPEFNDFYVLSGPNQSTSIQYVNGAMTSSKTLSFILKPRAEGKFTIGKATMEIDGTVMETEPIVVEVVKSAATPNQGQKPKANTIDPQVSNEDIFLKSFISKKTAYLGEQILVEYKLYFKQNVRTYEIDKMPPNAGFWTEDFEMPGQPAIESEIVNGVNYNVATLKKVAIFPTRVGELVLEPMVVNLEAVVATRSNRRSLFDSFFEPQGRSVRKTVNSNAVKLAVKPLPEKGKPAGFSGAVGSFSLDASIDKKTAAVNEAIALKINLSGSGNIKLTELPKVEIPSDIEQYDPKTNSNISKNNNTISGSKSAEYILIPRVPGEFKIKPLTFSFFNPQKRQYETRSTRPIILTITGVANTLSNTPMAGFSRKEVTLLGTDIRFIKEKTVFIKTTDHPYFSGENLGGFLLGLLSFIGFLFYDDRRAKISGNKVLARNKYAGKLASKLLSEARKNIKSEKSELFYKSLNAALSKFVQDKMNIDLTDFNIQNARQALTEKNIPEDIINEYTTLVDECYFSQFSGMQSSTEEKSEVLQKARNTITKMEKYI